MTTKEAGADRRALAAGMMRLLGLSAGNGETNKYVEQPPHARVGPVFGCPPDERGVQLCHLVGVRS